MIEFSGGFVLRARALGAEEYMGMSQHPSPGHEASVESILEAEVRDNGGQPPGPSDNDSSVVELTEDTCSSVSAEFTMVRDFAPHFLLTVCPGTGMLQHSRRIKSTLHISCVLRNSR